MRQLAYTISTARCTYHRLEKSLHDHDFNTIDSVITYVAHKTRTLSLSLRTAYMKFGTNCRRSLFSLTFLKYEAIYFVRCTVVQYSSVMLPCSSCLSKRMTSKSCQAISGCDPDPGFCVSVFIRFSLRHPFFISAVIITVNFHR